MGDAVQMAKDRLRILNINAAYPLWDAGWECAGKVLRFEPWLDTQTIQIVGCAALL
jgi:hypothetical protein